jgi:hypothetical protein
MAGRVVCTTRLRARCKEMIMPRNCTVVHVHTKQEFATILHTLAAMRATSIRAVVEEWATAAAIDAGLSPVSKPPRHVDSVEVEWTYADRSDRCLLRHLPVVVEAASEAGIIYVDLSGVHISHRAAAVAWLQSIARGGLRVHDASLVMTDTLDLLVDDLDAGIDWIQGCYDERADLLRIADRCDRVAAKARERASTAR